MALLALGNSAAVYLVARALRGLNEPGNDAAWAVMKRGFLARRENFSEDGWKYWRAAIAVQLMTLVGAIVLLLFFLFTRR